MLSWNSPALFKAREPPLLLRMPGALAPDVGPALSAGQPGWFRLPNYQTEPSRLLK